jgi:hypothetical protein
MSSDGEIVYVKEQERTKEVRKNTEIILLEFCGSNIRDYFTDNFTDCFMNENSFTMELTVEEIREALEKYLKTKSNCLDIAQKDLEEFDSICDKHAIEDDDWATVRIYW